jgi:hypothetical protein
VAALSMMALGAKSYAQVVINEIVEDEQDFESTDITPDTREFIELYNSGNSPVDISGWTLGGLNIDDSVGPVDTFPGGSTIPAHGYFVIGAATVPNVNFTPAAGELWANGKTLYELRNPTLTGSTLVDAVALETFRTSETDLLTQEQLDQVGPAGQTAGPGARGGWWGQIESNDAHPTDHVHYPDLPLSIARFKDGRDSNVNGRDFGMLPITPGAKNDLPSVPALALPNVDSMAVGTVLRNDFYGSFKLPTVVDPAVGGGTLTNPNTTAITPSPQGGKVIVAWDETGGGNAVFSKSYVNKFEISAFIDPRPFSNTTADSNMNEATIYGIGSTDIFFASPNSADLLTGQPGAGGNITSSANGSTGLGWVIQRNTSNAAGTQTSKAVLQLVDFGDGGDGFLADMDWTPIPGATIDISSQAQGWHTLSIDYDPATGAVVAKYDAQTFNFSTITNLVGNFYVGYREGLPGTGSTIARPPTFDLIAAAPANNADFNNDGKVDGADFLIWQKGQGLSGQTNKNNGDANGDGNVNGADLALWKTKFGGPPASAAAAGVPEPSSIGLAACALAALLAKRRAR